MVVVVDEWDLCLKAVLGMEMGFVFETVLEIGM